MDTTNGKNINRNNYVVNYCIDCGKIISSNSMRCIKCESKRRTSTEVKGITREELKTLIRVMPFTKIGEMYGVSDNAIRKWCDKYNLPRKTSDIKSYSEEEWLKI